MAKWHQLSACLFVKIRGVQAWNVHLSTRAVCVCAHIYERECKGSWNVSHLQWATCCEEPAGSIWSVCFPSCGSWRSGLLWTCVTQGDVFLISHMCSKICRAKHFKTKCNQNNTDPCHFFPHLNWNHDCKESLFLLETCTVQVLFLSFSACISSFSQYGITFLRLLIMTLSETKCIVLYGNSFSSKYVYADAKHSH